MSASVRFVARRPIADEDRRLVETYNSLCRLGVQVFPQELISALRNRIGKPETHHLGVEIGLIGDIVETEIRTMGDPYMDLGVIIHLGSLPEGTIEIRVFAE